MQTDTEDGWSNEMMAAREKLLALGAEEDPGMPGCFWLAGHCFAINSEGGIDEV